MVIGTAKIYLHIDEAFSLKEKRHVVKSIIERLRSRFNASVSEIDMNDKWKSALIGAACVSNETAHADRMISEIINFVENDGRAILEDYITEIIHI